MEDIEDSDKQALRFLATEGYLPLLLADHDGMVEAYSDLFNSSQKFFDLSEESPEKTEFQAASGSAASEAGYSNLSGEKSLVTIKTSTRCPEILQQHAKTAWNLTGTFMHDIARKIAKSLNLHPEVFTPFVEPCCLLPKKASTPTLLRMFRYIRPQDGQPTVNAEHHKDIGMLSLVIGHSPGLEVLDAATGLWNAIEDEDFVPEEAKVRSGGLTATLLCGETMAFFTRGRYRARVHRVLCAPSRDNRYRFSTVFALRPAVAPVYTKNFESDIVGQFAPEERMEGESSRQLFQKIWSSHWSVNIFKDLREEQQKKLRARAGAATAGQAKDDLDERAEIERSFALEKQAIIAETELSIDQERLVKLAELEETEQKHLDELEEFAASPGPPPWKIHSGLSGMG